MRASFKQQLDATYVQTADGAKIPYAEYAKTEPQVSGNLYKNLKNPIEFP